MMILINFENDDDGGDNNDKERWLSLWWLRIMMIIQIIIKNMTVMRMVMIIININNHIKEEAKEEKEINEHNYLWYQQVALVTWTETVNLTLVKRDLNSMLLRNPTGEEDEYTILQIFPFTSETKRMGIIVKVNDTFFCLMCRCCVKKHVNLYNLNWV